MADEPGVNSVVSDAVSEVDVLGVGMGPAVSMSMACTAMATTIGMVMHNAATAQRGMQQVELAVVATSSALILSKV